VLIEDEFSYIANDARCLCAIKDLEGRMDTINWLGEDIELYMNVTFGPKDHPRIANCNYEGRKYEGILKFATLYIKSHHDHKDSFFRSSKVFVGVQFNLFRYERKL
jgi:hypothetical protein